MADNVIRQGLTATLALSVATLAAGCGGGSTGGSALSPQVAQKSPHAAAATAKAQLTIRIPIHKTAAANSSRKRPQYVSTSTKGLAIRVATVGNNGSAAWQLFDVSGASTICTAGAAADTCTVSVTAPVVSGQQDEFQVIATDQAPLATDIAPEGNTLSSGDFVETLTAGADNPLSFALTSIIGFLSLTPASVTVWAAPALTSTANVSIIASDLDNQIISGAPAAFGNPIVFGDTLGTASPFSYPSAGTPNVLVPPAAAGPIVAPITYTAPTAAAAPSTVVTVTTSPSYSVAVAPTATFTIDPLTAVVNNMPTAAVTGLAVNATDVPVTITENGAASFTVTTNASAPNNDGAFTLFSSPGVALTNPVAAPGGTATIYVHAVTATNVNANAPSISITNPADPAGTTAILSAAVNPAAAPTPPASTITQTIVVPNSTLKVPAANVRH